MSKGFFKGILGRRSHQPLGISTSRRIRPRIFISYSRTDEAVAESLRDDLIANDIDAFLDQSDIAPGEEWKLRLSGLIATAERIIFLISPASLKSSICEWEIDEAERLGKAVLPILVSEAEIQSIPGRLSRLEIVFWRDASERAQALPRLLSALRTNLIWEREKTRLNEAAEEWDSNGRPHRMLIHASAAIVSAEHWRDSQPQGAISPTEVQLLFISTSRKRHTSRQRRLVFVSSLVTVGMTALAVLALILRNTANEQASLAEASKVEAQSQRDHATSSARQAETTLLNYMANSSINEISAGKHRLGAALIGNAALRRTSFPFQLDDDVNQTLKRAALIAVSNDQTAGIFDGIQGAFLGPESDIVYINSKAGGAAVSSKTHATLRRWPDLEGVVHSGTTPGWRLFARSDDGEFFAVNRSSLQASMRSDDASLVRIFDRRRNDPVATLRDRAFSEMAFIPGSSLLVLTAAMDMRVVDARTGVVRVEYIQNEDASDLVVTREEFLQLKPSSSFFQAFERVAVSPDTEQLFAVTIMAGLGEGSKRRLGVFPYPTRRLASEHTPLVVTDGLALALEEEASGIFIAPQLATLAVSLKSKVALYSIPELKLLTSVEIEDGPISKAELSADRRRLAVGTESGLVQVVDLESARVVAKSRMDAAVGGVALSSDGRTVAAFSNENATVHVIDVENGIVKTLTIADFDIFSLDISSDGTSLLLSTRSGVVRVDLATSATVAWKHPTGAPGQSLGSDLLILGHQEDGLLVVDKTGALIGRQLRGRRVQWLARAGDAVIAATQRAGSVLDAATLSILTVAEGGKVVTEQVAALEPPLAALIMEASNTSSRSLTVGRNLSTARSADRLSLLVGHVLVDVAMNGASDQASCAPLGTISWCIVETQLVRNVRATDLFDLKDIEFGKPDSPTPLSSLLEIKRPSGFPAEITSALSSSGQFALWGADNFFVIQDLNEVRRGNAGIVFDSDGLKRQWLPSAETPFSLGQIRSFSGTEGFIVNLGNNYVAALIIDSQRARGLVEACPIRFCTAKIVQDEQLLLYNDEYVWSPFVEERLIEPILVNLKTKRRKVLKGHRDFVNRVAIGARSPLIATADRSGRVIIWNSAEAIEVARYDLQSPVASLSSANDGVSFIAITEAGGWKLGAAGLSLTAPQASEYLVASALTATAEASELTRLSLDKLPNPYQLAWKARSPTVANDMDKCAVLASHPLDPLRSGHGMPFGSIPTEEAITACEAALANNNDGRSAYHLYRALNASNQADKARASNLRAIRLSYAMAAVQSFVPNDEYQDEDLSGLAKQIRTLVEAQAAAGAPRAVYQLAREAYLRSNDLSNLAPALDVGEPSAFVLASKHLAQIDSPSALEETFLKASIADLLHARIYASEDREARVLRYNAAKRLPKLRVIELHRQAVIETERLLSSRSPERSVSGR